MTAYEEGKKACQDGKRRNDNPYHMATSAHDAWHDGYDEAEENATAD